MGHIIPAMNLEEAKPSAIAYINGRPESKMFTIDPGVKCVVFADASMASPEFAELFAADHPECTFHRLNVLPGKTLDDAIRVFHSHGGNVK